jgi:pimeloyl-ACP methyl ester carboxylesterase
MLDIAARLVSHGYNVLMFDLRGHGESDGSQISGGYFEKKDVLGAVNYVRQRSINRIGVLSFSMGAASSLMAAAETQDILALVADSSYADLEEIIDYQFSIRSNLPEFFIPLILFMAKTLYGIDFRAVKPVEAIKNISCPVFIIVGGRDDTVSIDQAQREFEASNNPLSRMWVLPESEHTRCYDCRPEEYVEKIEAFFDAVLANN